MVRLYFYDHDGARGASEIEPSARVELELTTVNQRDLQARGL